MWQNLGSVFINFADIKHTDFYASARMYIGYRGKKYPMAFLKNQNTSMVNYFEIRAVI